MSWFERNSARLQHGFRVIVVIALALTLIQPALAGFSAFDGRTDLTSIHEMIANILFLLAVILLVLAFVGGFQHRQRMLLCSVILLLLISTQIGLGYAGRESGVSLAIHIPNGVAVFGTTLLLSLMSYGLTLNRTTA